MRAIPFIVLAIPVLGLASVGRGDDWPQFRGPNGSGISTAKEIPTRWDANKNVAWKVKLPGYGWSSPIVLGDKVFVTTASTDNQKKPSGDLAGPGGKGGKGGPGGFPAPGQILPSFLQDMLKLTADQKGKLEDVQKAVTVRLDQVLGAEQKKRFKEPPKFEPGTFRGPPLPGQILSKSVHDELKLTPDQKKQLDHLQEEVDRKLDKFLSEEQKKQLKEIRERFSRGPSAFGGFPLPKAPENTYKFEVLCLDRVTGKLLWTQTAEDRKPAIPSFNNVYASETPVTDGERVYAYFGMHGLHCYSIEGKPIWSKNLDAFPLAFGFGTGSSPVLTDGRLFLQCDNEEKSFLLALEAKSGKEFWKIERLGKSSWCTPFVWKTKQRTELIVCGNKKVISYDPATGKSLWELGDINATFQASPTADAEHVYFGSGGPMGDGRLFAIRAGTSGDITLKKGETSNEGVAWVQPRSAPYVASPLAYQGFLYVLQGTGNILTCYDAKTGKQMYKERLGGARGFTASPWAHDGKVFCLDDGGTTHVIQAGPELRVLAENTINEMCWSSPAAGRGSLLLRTVDHLYCIK
jgi:outer membrane protein assembly factor BamB